MAGEEEFEAAGGRFLDVFLQLWTRKIDICMGGGCVDFSSGKNHSGQDETGGRLDHGREGERATLALAAGRPHFTQEPHHRFRSLTPKHVTILLFVNMNMERK